MVSDRKLNGTIEEISEDVDDLQEDIDSVDKKLWILIGLWVLDKIVIALMFVFLGS